MEQRPETRDPAVNAGPTGNGMEARRRGAPLPRDLPDAAAKLQTLE
jgi:hypothetical protein